jgi:hypothetical protein
MKQNSFWTFSFILAFCLASIALPTYATSHEPKNPAGPDLSSQLKDSIPIIQLFGVSAVLAAVSGWFALRWQKNQEKAKIRRLILKEYQESFKDFVILLDTFMAKLVLHYKSFDSNTASAKLSDYLPDGYRDVDDDSEKEWYKVKHKRINEEDIEHSALIVKRTNSYLNLPQTTPISVESLEKQFNVFEEEFFKKRGDVTKFLSSLRLYYKKSSQLEIEFNVIWMHLMANHMLILNMMENSKDFRDLLIKYHDNAKFIFTQMRQFEKILGQESIQIK